MQEVNSVDDWQSSKKKVVERTAYMFDNDLLSDVRFIVGKGAATKRIPAHKFLLSISSCVFNAMFNGPLASDADEIEICDIEPSAFHTLLRFLYTNTVEITDVETALSTLYAAEKYGIPALKAACVPFLLRNLSCENALLFLNQARLYDQLQLESKCWQLIDSSPEKVFAAKDFIDIDLDTLCSILSRDSLCIEEIDIFHSVLKWAVAECERQGSPVSGDNQRAVLGRALKLIRFPIMTAKQFSSSAVESGLLTKDEIISVFRYLTEGIKIVTKFKNTPRFRNKRTVTKHWSITDKFSVDSNIPEEVFHNFNNLRFDDSRLINPRFSDNLDPRLACHLSPPRPCFNP